MRLQNQLKRVKHSEKEPPDIQAAKVEELRAFLTESLPDLIADAVRDELRRSGVKADPEALLDKKGVADRLGVSERTVDTLAADGEIPKVRIRGRVKFHPANVAAYVRRMTEEVSA